MYFSKLPNSHIIIFDQLLEEIGAATLHQHEQATIAGKTDADNNDEVLLVSTTGSSLLII